MKEHSFTQSAGIEKIYRSAVLPALSHYIPYQDVGDDKAYFSSGIDFLHKNTEYNTTSDAKIDSYATGNLCFELYSSDRSGGSLSLNPGWGLKSISALVIYVFSATGECIVFDMNSMRNWIESNWEKFSTVSVYNRGRNGALGYLAWNVLVPIKELLNPVTGCKNAKIFDFAELIKAPVQKPLETKLAAKAGAAYASAAELQQMFKNAPEHSTPSAYDWDAKFEQIIRKDKFFSQRKEQTSGWMNKIELDKKLKASI